MKKHLLALIFSLVVIGGFSQTTFNIPFDTLIQTCPPDSVFLYLFADSGNSNAYTYDTIPYQTESVGGTTISMSDDQIQGPYNIGFTFSFYCGQYTQFYICSNGWIGFSNGQTQTWVVQSIPSTNGNTPKNNIMAPWRDWNPASGTGPYVSYQTVGTAPLRKLIVTWSAVPMYSCTSSQGTFQVVLHEASNIIHNNLTNVPVCTGWGNGDGTEGTHNAAGTIATAVAGRNDSQFTITNQSIRFIPTSPIVWTTLNGSPVGIGNGLTASFNQSTWVYANGVTCGNDSLQDSVYVAVSCINLEMDSLDVDCTNDSSGYAVAIDTSSVTNAPYTFYWVHDGTGDTMAINVSANDTDTLANAPAGSYTVYAFGSNSEFAIGFTSINQPDTVVGTFTGSIDVLCNGDSTGIAYAVDTNNYSGLNWDGLYSFYWTPDSTIIDSAINQTQDNDSLLNVSAGTYFVTVDGCLIQTGSVTVDEPTLVGASITNPTAVSCPGQTSCDASALGNGAGGVAPYTYSWSSSEGTQLAQALCPDSNWVTVTDANGCDTSTWVVIDVPDSIITTSFGDTTICITNIAAIIASSTGGTAPYDYVWTLADSPSDTVSLMANSSVNPEVTTRYFVSSTDANGCPGDTASVLIVVRPELGMVLPEIDTICPYDTIDVTAVGLGGDSLYTFSWSSGTFGPTATISPDESRWYNVTVSDFCGTPVFEDSVFVQVGGYSPIDANIRIEDDSLCAGESVYLIASGRGGHEGPNEYRFAWNQSSWDGNPIQFSQPAKTTRYIVNITDLCLSPAGADTAFIHVGEPIAPPFIANPTVSCTNAEVTISIAEWIAGYDYNWDLGDGDAVYNAQTDSIVHSYDDPGCYDVTLSVTTDFGCFAQRTEKCLIEILESPIADYLHSPENPNTLEPFIQFQDMSLAAESIQWYIDEKRFVVDSIFRYEFIDTGWYEVSLVATSEDGCVDTISKYLHNGLAQTLFIPRSFSPNGDGLNDVFQIVGEKISPEGFEFVVFDRWGHKVFYTKNPEFGWDGKRISNGEYVNAGSYPFLLHYRDNQDEPKKISGSIMVGKTGNPTGLK
ncbi:MAG: gliding motility-associated C-terminal domain-containing protein [Flavobacteriales bacterium]|nr:gliding motility-associated C-terminal domain-containing protein [Flavobacteriales bacterium]